MSGRLRQVLLYNQQSIYIYAYKCLCQCVGKVYYPNVNCGYFDMLGPIITENDPQFFAPWVTSAHQSWKKSEALLSSQNFWYLLITFAHSLGSNQEQQNIGPDIDPNRYSDSTPVIIFISSYLTLS